MRTKRHALSILSLLIIGTLFLAPISQGGKKQIKLKIATLAPEGSIWVKELQRCNQEIQERTDGQFKFKIYAGGIMGEDDVVIRKIRVGQLDGAVFTSNTLSKIYPDFQAFQLPYLFENDAEIEYLLKEMSQELADSFRKQKYESLGTFGIGFTYMFSKKPIKSVEDLRKSKGWMWVNDPVMNALYKAANVTPVALGIGDVMTALQTGLLDTVFNTPTGLLALQWFSKVNYMTDIPINYSFGTFLIAQRSWKKAPADIQKIIMESTQKSVAAITKKTLEEDLKAREVISERGVQIIEPTAEWKQDTVEISRKAKKNLTGKALSPDILARIESLLQKFRNK